MLMYLFSTFETLDVNIASPASPDGAHNKATTLLVHQSDRCHFVCNPQQRTRSKTC